MNRDIEQLNSILEKYELTDPISPEMQEFAIKSGRDNLKIILKKTGYYSAFFGLFLSLFYMTRSFGFKAAVLIKGKIIITVVLVNTIAAGAGGGYYINKYMLSKAPEKDPLESVIADRAHEQAKKDVAKKTVKMQSVSKKETLKEEYQFEYIIGNIRIQTFKGKDPALAKKITANIAVNLKKIKGTGITKIQNTIQNNEKKDIAKMVMGSIRTLGGTTFITARVVNAKNARVEFVASQQIDSPKDLDEACGNISKKIAEKIQ
ncbi:MAG: hypothetical protein GY754_22965 [bacterium]|nr:hypothetical protein [bacterium]